MTGQSQDFATLQKTLAQHIRSLRIKRGWSQKLLADHSDTTTTHIAKIERGELDVRLATLHALAEALGTTIAQLFRGIA
jgi:transcriptional regulator with XRE-family HTH domain